MSMLSRSAARTGAVVAFSVAATSFASAQSAPAAAPAINPTVLKVGDVAPEFTVAAVTAAGLDAKPFKLSEHKGETIVLAFFPKARTSGCTMQMHAYRDKFNEVFKGGKKVTLVGVSIDEDSALTSLRASGPGYPLRGRLKISDAPFEPARETTALPGRGEAWLDSRLLARLGARVGGRVNVGATTFAVTQVLDYRPDQGSAFVDLAPSLLINLVGRPQ